MHAKLRQKNPPAGRFERVYTMNSLEKNERDEDGQSGRSNGFLATIFIDSPIGIYIVQNGRFVFVNPEFQRISGYDEKELLGTDSIGIVLSEDQEQVREDAVQMLKGERHVPYEHRVVAKSGEIRWITETVTSIMYRDKRAVLGYFMDRTEHEREKESLFFDSPIGIYIIQRGKFIFVNPEFQRILGFDEKELLGKVSLNIVLPDDRDRVRANAIQMLKGERRTPYEHRVVTKEGEIRWIIETVTSIKYRGEQAVLGYFMDHTEYERAKEALSLSEDKFRKAFRSSPDWFVISTLEDGFYIDVNEAFLHTTGYRRDEVIGHTSTELGIWADPQERVEMTKILKDQGMVRNLEARFRTKSGDIRHVLWSAEVMDYGEEKCLIAVTRDITDRKRAEQEHVEREKLQGVLETAGAACHELNQPLQYIYLLLSEAQEENPESEALAQIKKQCNRLKDITSKLEKVTVYQTREYIKGMKIIDIDKASGE
ncbi:MAG: PAS domain S-box protein [Deltaproteobacteria bacterium]|nr:PAS domain S-box protein [Deltaproteobacteria bacterium]